MQKCGHCAALSFALLPLFQSPPLFLSFFFCLFLASLSCFPFSASFLSLSIHSLCLNVPRFASSPCCSAYRLTPTFLFLSLLIFLSLLVILIHAFLFSHISQSFILSSSLPLSFSPPLHSSAIAPSQCSCRRTRPTRCCTGCAGPTSCWRR